MKIADFKKSILSYTQMKQIKEMEIYGMLASLGRNITLLVQLNKTRRFEPELNLSLLSHEASCFCMI